MLGTRIQWSSARVFRPEHFLWTQCTHFEHKMLDTCPTPVRHTAQGNLPESRRTSRLIPEAMNFFPHVYTETFCLHTLLPGLDPVNTLFEKHNNDNKVINKKRTQGTPILKSLDKASSTVIKCRVLSTEP